MTERDRLRLKVQRRGAVKNAKTDDLAVKAANRLLATEYGNAVPLSLEEETKVKAYRQTRMASRQTALRNVEELNKQIETLEQEREKELRKL